MVNGFLVIDKPVGLSSHDVVNRVRRILGIKKVGHTGTLDPFATGVLPIAVSEATKAIQFLDEGIKQYEAVIRLGFTTDTQDITGQVLSEQQDLSGIDEEQLLDKMALLTGDINQVPPMFSAIKQGGQPLYKLARKGVEVKRDPRRITVHSFELLVLNLPFVSVRVACSPGTYIRTIADDLGKLLGCGACLTELRRISSGPFEITAALTLEQLSEYVAAGVLQRYLVDIQEVLCHLGQFSLAEPEYSQLKNGIPPFKRLAEYSPGLFRLTYNNHVTAVAELTPCKKIVLKRVFN